MSTGTLVSLDEYLNTSYRPECEYRDGQILERNVGDLAHARLQTKLAVYIDIRGEQWNVEPFTELRIKIIDRWCPVPDVCLYPRTNMQGRYPTEPPILWIEILSHDDSMAEVWQRANELIALGVPYVWIIEPNTLESELRSPAGAVHLADKVLRLPEYGIVIPLLEVMQGPAAR